MATVYKVKIDMAGGGRADVQLDMTNSTIKFSTLPEELPSEDWASIQDFLAACGRLMRNPRILKAEVEREI